VAAYYYLHQTREYT